MRAIPRMNVGVIVAMFSKDEGDGRVVFMPGSV